MNKKLKKFIKTLSLNDSKTLSQKALKTTEEVGELAKSILPFDSAPGTNHRFVDKEKILEEIADIFLTSISIAYSLDFDDDDIEEMIYKKSQKWSEIQSREKKSNFPLPFEIHITVDGNLNLNNFKETCEEIKVKPIVLDLETNNDIIKDYMTSSKHFGDNKTAFDESQRIVKELENNGFKVLRTKIETVPWHPAAPIDKEKMPLGSYFESHIGVIITPQEKDSLSNFTKDLSNKNLSGKAKLSQNFFKKSKNGEKFVNMLTYRSTKTNKDNFESEVNLIKNLLTDNNFYFEKVEIEYSIYDTNIKHDSKWIQSS